MSAVDERLLHEARARPRQAIIAVVAGVFLVLAAVLQLSGPHTKVDELTLDLLTANKRIGLDVGAAVINAIGSLTMAWTLYWLAGAARARNPAAQPWSRFVAIVGGIGAAIAGIAYASVIATKAHEFATTGSQTYQEANHLTSSSPILVLQLIGQASALLLALAFVLISLNAMRVGLLTRFLGYLGLLAGALILFQITQVPIVQAYWLFAVAYLLSGRWPSGVPPAWASGRAEPWPSSAEMREQRMRAAAARGATRRGKPAAPAPETVGAPASGSSPAAAGRATRPAAKRKRKRRK